MYAARLTAASAHHRLESGCPAEGPLIRYSLTQCWLTLRSSFPLSVMYDVPVCRSYTLYKYGVHHYLYDV